MTKQDHDASNAKIAISRRTILQSSAALGLTGIGGLAVAPAHAAMGKGSDEINVKPDGTYDVVPLKKDTINLAVIQCRVNPPEDPNNPEPTIQENLDHMIDLIDTTMSFGVRLSI